MVRKAKKIRSVKNKMNKEENFIEKMSESFKINNEIISKFLESSSGSNVVNLSMEMLKTSMFAS